MTLLSKKRFTQKEGKPQNAEGENLLANRRQALDLEYFRDELSLGYQIGKEANETEGPEKDCQVLDEQRRPGEKEPKLGNQIPPRRPRQQGFHLGAEGGVENPLLSVENTL